MSHLSDDDQPLNFGSDLSIKACIGNCLQGECCDCDYHPGQFDNSGGQLSPAPYQHPTAHESLLSIASSGQGPSQPRPIVQQYQSTQPMDNGSASLAGRGNPVGRGGYDGASDGHYGSYVGYSTNQRGVFIAPQYPSGFTTQASTYAEDAEVTAYQQSMGWFRDGSKQLYNSQGQPINEEGQIIQPPSSSMPQSSPTSGFSGSESFNTAPSHVSGSSGNASRDGSHKSRDHHGKKHKKH